MKKKGLYVKLSSSDNELLDANAQKRKLDRSNYIRYLIRNDQDDLYSEKASEALNIISSSAECLQNILCGDQLDQPNMDPDMLRENCNLIIEGVKELWHCLR